MDTEVNHKLFILIFLLLIVGLVFSSEIHLDHTIIDKQR